MFELSGAGKRSTASFAGNTRLAVTAVILDVLSDLIDAHPGLEDSQAVTTDGLVCGRGQTCPDAPGVFVNVYRVIAGWKDGVVGPAKDGGRVGWEIDTGDLATRKGLRDYGCAAC